MLHFNKTNKSLQNKASLLAAVVSGRALALRIKTMHLLFGKNSECILTQDKSSTLHDEQDAIHWCKEVKLI